MLYDVVAGRTLMQLPAGIDVQDATGVKVFPAGGLLIVDVTWVEATSHSRPPSSSVRLSNEGVGGHWTAVDPAGGGRVAWTADVGRGVVLTGRPNSPVLLHMSRVRSHRKVPDRTSLSVIRVRDGQTLATSLALPRTPWLRLEKNGDASRLTVSGVSAEVHVDLRGEASSPGVDPPPTRVATAD